MPPRHICFGIHSALGDEKKDDEIRLPDEIHSFLFFFFFNGLIRYRETNVDLSSLKQKKKRKTNKKTKNSSPTLAPAPPRMHHTPPQRLSPVSVAGSNLKFVRHEIRLCYNPVVGLSTRQERGNLNDFLKGGFHRRRQKLNGEEINARIYVCLFYESIKMFPIH